MKNLLLVIAFLIVTPSITSAQSYITQNSIIGIEDTQLKANFLLKEKNGVYPVRVEENNYSDIFGISLTIMEFNENRLLTSKIEDMFGVYDKAVYTYYNNYQLSLRSNYDSSGELRGMFPKTVYEYNESGNLVHIKSQLNFLTQINIDEFSYFIDKGYVDYAPKGGNKKKFIINNKFLVKERLIYLPKGIISSTKYTYDDYKRVIKTVTINDSSKPDEISTAEFTYNNQHHIFTYNGITEIISNYIYDDYGNWIAKYRMLDSEPLKNITLRKINYSNGTSTGYKTNAEKLLIEAIEQATKKPKGVIAILTNKGKSYVTYKNGINISKDDEHFKLYIYDNDLVFQNFNDKEIYIIKNYKSKENYKYNDLHPITAELGFWLRTSEDGFNVYDTQGKGLLVNVVEHGFDANTIDYVLVLKSGKKLLLKNYSNQPINEPSAIQLYTENDLNKTNNNNSNKIKNVSRKPIITSQFSSCQDLKCLEGVYAVLTLRCGIETSCNGKEYADDLNKFIDAAEQLNLLFNTWESKFKDNIDGLILYNYWSIYSLLESDINQKYKDQLLSYLSSEQKLLLSQMKQYKIDGNLKTNLPQENVGFSSYEMFDNALGIYRLDQRENEILKDIERQLGQKQTMIKSKINLDAILPKLIAPENRLAYWQKTDSGIEVVLVNVNKKIDIAKTVNFGNHAVVFDEASEYQYVLRNFNKVEYNVKYEVITYYKKTVLWIKSGNSVEVLKDGNLNNVSVNDSFESPREQLIIVDNQKYILDDFDNVKNNIINNASPLTQEGYAHSQTEKAPSIGAYWKSYDNLFYLVQNGKYIDSDVTPNFQGNDAVLYHSKTNTTYIFNQYQSRNDGKWRKAIVLKGDNQAVWIKYENGNFNCYEKANKQINKNEWSTKSSNDLWIKDYNNKTKYVLKNYKNAKLNTFFIAERATKNDVNTSKNSNSNNTTKKASDKGTCIKGNCENGFGKKEYSNGTKVEGFFENGAPYGPIELIDSNKNMNTFTSYKGNYNEPTSFEYIHTKGESTLYLDYESGLAFGYFVGDNEIRQLYLTGKVVTNFSKISQNNDEYCIAGNCEEGLGYYKYNNGATYMGFFKNGEHHGVGELAFASGDFYVGEFVNGQKAGLGTYHWSSKNYYYGEYVNDTYHGKGVMVFANGTQQDGLWRNGEFIKSLNGEN
jgi:hypothetical protein